jgi:subtilisin-like proprotein convertase family protein
MPLLFHREVFMPPKIAGLPNTVIEVIPTAHALKAATGDRYGAIEVPNKITFSGKDIVEAEVLERRLVKVLIRLDYDATRDLLIALTIPEGRAKTVWFNLKSDKHSTLRREIYAEKI